MKKVANKNPKLTSRSLSRSSVMRNLSESISQLNTEEQREKDTLSVKLHSRVADGSVKTQQASFWVDGQTRHVHVMGVGDSVPNIIPLAPATTIVNYGCIGEVFNSLPGADGDRYIMYLLCVVTRYFVT